MSDETPSSGLRHHLIFSDIKKLLLPRDVHLTVRLPRDLAVQAERLQQDDPAFLARIVLYGLTRRSIYRHLNDPALVDPTRKDASTK